MNIESPERLLELWKEYKQFVDDNPDIQQQVTAKGVFKFSVREPYQRKGFESFVFDKYGFHVHQYIDNYNNAYENYLGVVTHMRNEWEADQIGGSLTGRYKSPNLVARLNGYADKSEMKHDGSISVEYDLSKVKSDTLKELLNAATTDQSS